MSRRNPTSLPTFALLVFIGCFNAGCASASIDRKYREGEQISFFMNGVNQGRRYDATGSAEVKKDSLGGLLEEVTWKSLIVDGKPQQLSERDVGFRQLLSLSKTLSTPFPDIRGLHPYLVGPVFDLMTFYVDLQLTYRSKKLHKPGDKDYIVHGKPNSWADGSKVLVGEDCIDFSIELKSIDSSSETIQVEINHVPPPQLCVRLPANWMKSPVQDTPNNWVQVTRNTDGTYAAAVGKEVFLVQATVSLRDGRILFASMDNPVDVVERQCKSADLAESQCGPSKRTTIFRKIDLRVE